MSNDPRGWGLFAAALILAAVCCAAPALLALGAGALSGIGGFLSRSWPLALIGLVLVVGSMLWIVHVLRRRPGASPEEGETHEHERI
jgi:membrane protein implicated in regulation of membrane protease activity